MSMKVWWLAFIGGLGVLVLIALSIARMYGPPSPTPADAPTASAPAAPKETAHITATLFFGSPDGQALVPVRRDVPLAPTVVEQGRQILTAQLTSDPPPPLLNVIPSGTMLRAFYVTERGDAFVDLSSDVMTGHPGGSLNELLDRVRRRQRRHREPAGRTSRADPRQRQGGRYDRRTRGPAPAALAGRFARS